MQVDVNSGGRVFFCFFAPAVAGGPEGVAVLKFAPTRLLMQVRWRCVQRCWAAVKGAAGQRDSWP